MEKKKGVSAIEAFEELCRKVAEEKGVSETGLEVQQGE